MKRMFISAVLLLCACAAAVSAAQFEGKAVYRINTGGRDMDMTLYIKDQKSRVEIGGIQGMTTKILMDWGVRESYMLMEEQEVALKVPLKVPAVMSKSIDKDAALKPVKTGKTKKILGRDCEQWILNTGDNTIEFWSAKGLGNLAGFMGQAPLGVGTGFPDVSAIAGLEEFFPMSVIMKNKAGHQTFSMEAQSVEPQKLAESAVSVPSSYRIVDTPPSGARLRSGE